MAKTPIKYYVVDAFTESAFKGNPAAVCLLDQERDEDWLQRLAVEFNMSQTCYLTRIAHLTSLTPRFRLRWFTPVTEVKLCGHATLAAAHILFSTGLVDSDLIEFETLSGILTAKRIPDVLGADKSTSQNGGGNGAFMIQLDFPIVPLITGSSAIDASAISKALNGASLLDMKRTATEDDLLVELPSGKSVSEFQPQIDEIQKCPGGGIIITAVAPPESGFDFISRFFCPKYGINEDPVCGSAHCALATYWSEKLRKSDFVAYQASPRGGILKIQLDKQTQRVLLQGKAVTVMEGSILV